MSQSLTMYLIAVGAVAILYPLAMRALLRKAQPWRLELAAVGDDLLSSPYVDESDKQTIESMLDDAFNWRSMASMAWFIPVLAIRRLIKRRMNGLPDIRDAATKKAFDRFMTLFVRSIMVANPLATFICVVEMTALTPVLFLAGQMKQAPALVMSAARCSEHHRRAA